MNIYQKVVTSLLHYKADHMKTWKDYEETVELARQYGDLDLERGLMYRYDYEGYLEKWGF